MRILVAPNAFKGSLDAWGAAESIAEGLARGLPASETILSPVADGGDGTAAVLMRGLGGRMVACEVVDPLGYAAGRYELDVSGGVGTCGPGSAEPDLTVPVDVLSGAFLGGTSLLALRQAGRVEEHRPGAVAKADQLFRWPVPPVCLTWF